MSARVIVVREKIETNPDGFVVETSVFSEDGNIDAGYRMVVENGMAHITNLTVDPIAEKHLNRIGGTFYTVLANSIWRIWREHNKEFRINNIVGKFHQILENLGIPVLWRIGEE